MKYPILIHNRVVFRTAAGAAGSYITAKSWKNGCQKFSCVHTSRKHWKCKYLNMNTLTIFQGTRFTIEYLLKVISKLKPITSEEEGLVYEKLLSYLTHHWVTLNSEGNGAISTMSSWAMSTRDTVDMEDHHWGNMKLSTALRLFTFFSTLQKKLTPEEEKAGKWRCR